MPNNNLRDIEGIYRKKLKEKTDIQRALMGFSMFETSRYLVKLTVIKEGMTEEDIKMAVFDRFYYNDFDKVTKQKILKHLTSN